MLSKNKLLKCSSRLTFAFGHTVVLDALRSWGTVKICLAFHRRLAAVPVRVPDGVQGTETLVGAAGVVAVGARAAGA